MTDLPHALREGLATVLARVPTGQLASSVQHLMTEYRSGQSASTPIVSSSIDAGAYAAYRMPATFAAVRAALRQLAHRVPDFAPRTLVDVGGGTGSAVWAATEVFPKLVDVTVLDQAAEALTLGRDLARRSELAPVRTATWQPWRAGAPLPEADLITISYVLGELPAQAQADLVEQAVRAGTAVVVVEPGTPAGYRRVLAARAALLERGHTVQAPCPHQSRCPLEETRDWCHFAARINRSVLHRRLKAATLGYEDEKFSYVAAISGARYGQPSQPDGSGRVLRHPQYRKGLVTLEVCAASGRATKELVSKRQNTLYRQARDAAWGDLWPTAPVTPEPGQE